MTYTTAQLQKIQHSTRVLIADIQNYIIQYKRLKRAADEAGDLEEEYFYQRAGCEYLIGLARGMGVKVVIPHESALCKASYVYGYSEPPNPEVFNPLIKYVKDRAKECGDNKVKLVASLEAVNTSDLTKLRHSGLFSVQLQPPGTTAPEPETPALPPAT